MVEAIAPFVDRLERAGLRISASIRRRVLALAEESD